MNLVHIVTMAETCMYELRHIVAMAEACTYELSLYCDYGRDMHV